MRLPSESSSSWVHAGFAAYTWASLKAWSEFTELPKADQDVLAALATALRGSIDALVKEARETQDELIFGRPEAQAKQNACLLLLRRVASEALSMVAARLGQGAKSSQAAREFLPDMLATIVKKPIADRAEAGAKAAKRLENLGDFTEKASLVARLSAAAATAQAAVLANGAAFNAWGQERSEEVVAKGRLRLELERTHRALGAHFVGQRDFVESFFLKAGKPSEGAAEDEADAPPGGDTE